MGKGIPLARIHIRQLLTGLGLLVVLLLAAAFVLGLLSLKRTSEIVSQDFQQQQLILAKTTAGQMEDGLEFLRGSSGSSIFPAIQYLEKVAWANRMQVTFNDLSKLGVTAIVRIDITGANGSHIYILDAGRPQGSRLRCNQYAAPRRLGPTTRPNAAAFARGRWHWKRVEARKRPFFDLATPVY